MAKVQIIKRSYADGTVGIILINVNNMKGLSGAECASIFACCVNLESDFIIYGLQF
jgi:hypothetical protein